MNKRLLSLGVLGIACLTLMAGCNLRWLTGKSKTEMPSTTSIPLSTITADYLLSQSIKYKHWKGKANANYQNGTIDQNVSLNIESVYGRETLMSVRAGMMGVKLEVAVAYATPDTVKAIDKVNSTYFVYSMEEAAELLNAPLDFGMLQALLVGNPILQDADITHWMQTDSTAHILRSRQGYEEELVYDLSTQKLKQLVLRHTLRQFRAEVNYDDYRVAVPSVSFAYAREITLDYEGKRNVLTLNFTEVNFQDPVNIRFSVPTSYRLQR